MPERTAPPMAERVAPMVEGGVRVLRPSGFHRMHYTRWGAEGRAAPPVLCAHGLTRTGRDFDDLAQDLADQRALWCPDVLGRGRSDWLSAAEGYSYQFYLSDMAAMIARMGAEQVDWIGTSMGGVIGLLMASTRAAPLRRMVINDVGPLIEGDALRRIARYVTQEPVFTTMAQLEAHLRAVHAPFGPLSDQHWARMARHSARPCPEGKGWRLHYDPQIALALGEPERIGDVDLWTFWDMIDIPVLAIRGETSDLLSPTTLAMMAGRGPGARGLVQTLVVPGVGHAPTLVEPEVRKAIRAFLEG